ncbi:MAG: uroporphyrinogen-III C-methyltransferase [Rhodocyclaceae bacterium]|nr:uroporphyrinogen-III C-methyltransferase [Rhodocyclaceae bacterium]
MNEEKTSATPILSTPSTAASADQPGGGAPPLALWLAGLALLGVLVLAWLAWQGNERVESTRQELSRRLTDSDAAQREALANAKQNREALDALQAKVGALEAQLAEAQSQQLALQTMYQELSRVRDDRLLAEIEQDVSIAAQQLQMAGNVEAALIALQGAEARLAKSAQPQFLPLRKLIVRDIERLKALPGADVTGIALKLDTLLNAVPGLPLAFEQRPAPAAVAAAAAAAKPPAAVPSAPTFDQMIRAWLGELWQEVRQLVRIERIDRPDPGLLAPRETFFLRENLRLRLLAARLALLARDGRSFQSDLKQADDWLGHYFDTRASAVQDAQATLRSLIKLDVMREPAQLNETLSALRNFKLARDRGPTR